MDTVFERTSEQSGQSSGLLAKLEGIAVNSALESARFTDAFFVWQRQEILLKAPTPDSLKEHDRAFLLLKTTLGFHLKAATRKDYPDKRIAPMLKMKLQKLNDSWEFVHNPMTDREAQEIFNKCFPSNEQ